MTATGVIRLSFVHSLQNLDISLVKDTQSNTWISVAITVDHMIQLHSDQAKLIELQFHAQKRNPKGLTRQARVGTLAAIIACAEYK